MHQCSLRKGVGKNKFLPPFIIVKIIYVCYYNNEMYHVQLPCSLSISYLCEGVYNSINAQLNLVS